jgi:hypothetical protein
VPVNLHAVRLAVGDCPKQIPGTEEQSFSCLESTLGRPVPDKILPQTRLLLLRDGRVSTDRLRLLGGRLWPDCLAPAASFSATQDWKHYMSMYWLLETKAGTWTTLQRASCSLASASNRTSTSAEDPRGRDSDSQRGRTKINTGCLCYERNSPANKTQTKPTYTP